MYTKNYIKLAWIVAIESAGPLGSQVATVEQLVQIVVTDAAIAVRCFHGLLTLGLLQQRQ